MTVVPKAAFRLGSNNGLSDSGFPTDIIEANSEERVLGGYDLVPFTSFSPDISVNHTGDATLQGGAGMPETYISAKNFGFSTSLNGKYEGLDKFFAATMGFEKPDTTDSPSFDTSGSGDSDTINGTNQNSSNVAATNSVFSSDDEGKFVRITSGTGQGQVRRIVEYVSGTEVLVDNSDGTKNWNVDPQDGDSFEFAGYFEHTFELSNNMGQENFADLYDNYGTYPTGGVYSSSDQIIRRGTFGVRKAGYTDAAMDIFQSAMINDITIDYNINDGMTVEVNLVAFRKTNSADKSQNADNWEYSKSSKAESVVKRIIGTDASFELGDFGGILSTFGINNFNLSIDNGLIDDDQTTTTGNYIEEPVRDDMREVTGSFEENRKLNEDHLEDMLNGNLKIAKISFTSGTGKYIEIYLPKIKITNEDSNVDSVGKPPVTAEFTCFNAEGTSGILPSNVVIDDPYSQVVIVTKNRNPFNQFLDQNKEY